MGKPIVSPIILDIEASGFGAHSYPIEIGVALSVTERFCRLIRPQCDWLHWSEEAQALHGISRAMLIDKGTCAQQVCIELNRLLNEQTVYSDGWVVDSPWLTRLYASAGVKMSFKLSQLDLILTEQQMDNWQEAKADIIGQTQGRRHRASHDAAVILKTFLATRNQFPQ